MSKPTRSDHPCSIRDAPISGDSYPVADTSWCFDRWAKKVAKLPDDSPESAWPPIDWVLFREGGLGGGVHTVRLGEAAAYPVGPGEGPWLFGTAGITV